METPFVVDDDDDLGGREKPPFSRAARRGFFDSKLSAFLLGFAFAVSVMGVIASLTIVDQSSAAASCMVEPASPAGPSHAATSTTNHSPHDATNPAPLHTQTENKLPVQFSHNWAGAALTAPPEGSSRFAAVLATVTLPRHALLAHNTSGPRTEPWSAAVWVGLDGATRRNAILQTGITMTLYPSGAVGYHAWYEWWPARSLTFPLTNALEPGDTVDMEAVMYNETHGKATLVNRNKHETVDQFLELPTPEARLSGANAEWILEDFWLTEQRENVPLVDFDQLEMVNCRAYTDTNELVPADKGKIYWMKQGSMMRAQAGVEDKTITFQYIQ